MRLIRVASLPEATFGVLCDEHGLPFAVTMERPWLQNEAQVSCIPTGAYKCQRVDSPKFGDTFEVTGVPGRSSILFHKGNFAEDTHGCILVGEMFEPIGHQTVAIQASAQGFANFLTVTRGRLTFDLVVSNGF